MVKIGTHNGSFHSDESLSCFFILTLPEYTGATIVRTRDAAILDKCDVVLDVGGEYDVKKMRLDHHQAGFNEVYPKQSIKLSSAGLVFREMGSRIVSTIIKNNTGSEPSARDVETLQSRMYREFVAQIDAIDNGIPSCDCGNQRYQNKTDLSSRISRMNKKWNESNYDEDAKFRCAVDLAGAEFTEMLMLMYTVWLPARNLVLDAYNNRTEPWILVLSQCCPWTEHLYNIEKENDAVGSVLYVIYSDGPQYRVHCVGIEGQAFACREYLPAPWRGVRDDLLSGKSGVPGAVFVHASGFIGGNKTLDGALLMARKSHEMMSNNA